MWSVEHRRSWQSHPRLATQSLLLESHDAFIAAGAELQARVARVDGGEGLNDRQILRFSQRLAVEFQRWQWSMRCHERYEEDKLYPFLHARFDTDCLALAEDHERLHALASACREALESAAQAQSEGHKDYAPALSAIALYRGELALHLQREECLVIPSLLSLSAEEFATYASSESCAARPAPESHAP